jgi:hypothetical protein
LIYELQLREHNLDNILECKRVELANKLEKIAYGLNILRGCFRPSKLLGWLKAVD